MTAYTDSTLKSTIHFNCSTPIDSVGYDTSKLYRDTDTVVLGSELYHDTDTSLIHLPKCIMILIHFKSIMILDTLLILLENLSKPQS